MSLSFADDPELTPEDLAALGIDQDIVPPSVEGPLLPTPGIVDDTLAQEIPSQLTAPTGADSSMEGPTELPPGYDLSDPANAEYVRMFGPGAVGGATRPGETSETGRVGGTAPVAPGQAGSAAPQAAGAPVGSSAQAATDAAIELDRQKQPFVAERAKISREALEAEKETLRQQQEIRQRFDAAEKQAQGQIAQTQEALKGFQFRDYFADKSSALKVGSALAVALGAFGAALTKTPNYALQILDKAMDDDHQLQVGKLKMLQDDEVMARTGLKDAQEGRTRALADLTQLDAQKDRVVAKQVDEAAAREKDDTKKAAFDAFSAKLKAEADAKDAAAKKLLLDEAVKKQHAALVDEHLKAQTANQNALAAKHGREKRGGGGAGGGGDSAFSKFVAAANTLKPGDPITEEIAVLGRHAGLKPNQVAAEVDKYRGSGAKAAKSEALVDRVAVQTKLAQQRLDNVSAALKLTDADGNDLGIATSPTDAVRLRKQLSAFDQVKERTEALIGDIKENGDRIDLLSTDAANRIQHRESLGAALAGAARVFNQLSSTDSSQKLEQMIIGAMGTPGHGFIMGANAGVLQHTLEEANRQNLARIRTALRPGSAPAGSPGAPAPKAGPKMVTITNAKTKETKQVTEDEARRMGAIK